MYDKNKKYDLFGRKILNKTNNEIGILCYTWDNAYSDSTISFAVCVDKNGNKYNIEMENIIIK